MFDFIDRMFEREDAKQAPYMFDVIRPINLKFWICGVCFKVAPAMGLQAECPPTDWEKHTIAVSEEIPYHKTMTFLICPDCKEENDDH